MGDDDSPKARLRRALHARRNSVAAEDLARGSQSICERIAATAVFRDARHVVLYAARRGEVDPVALAVAAAARPGRVAYYPRVEGGALVFRRATRDALVTGTFGIPEPPGDAAPLDPKATGVLILVPGLGFDRLGNRLGTGKGYYDRTLPRYANAIRLGLALDACVLDHVPCDPWDVAMHAVVTDCNLFVADGKVGAYPGDSPWS